jgi:hypothetical protein
LRSRGGAMVPDCAEAHKTAAQGLWRRFCSLWHADCSKPFAVSSEIARGITMTKLTTLALSAAFSFVAPLAAQGGGLNAYLQSLPIESVSPYEALALRHMREEEKLARDVYLVLHQTWNLPVFANIAQSEQSHMDLVAWGMQRYQIPDPLPSLQIGVFAAPEFTQLFQLATSFGSISPLHALFVGAVIEDLDVVDLDAVLAVTDNRDLDTIWQNLQRGSRNHMRAFYPQLLALGLPYQGLYLTTAEVQAIVTTPTESRPVDEDGVPLF